MSSFVQQKDKKSMVQSVKVSLDGETGRKASRIVEIIVWKDKDAMDAATGMKGTASKSLARAVLIQPTVRKFGLDTGLHIPKKFAEIHYVQGELTQASFFCVMMQVMVHYLCVFGPKFNDTEEWTKDKVDTFSEAAEMLCSTVLKMEAL